MTLSILLGQISHLAEKLGAGFIISASQARQGDGDVIGVVKTHTQKKKVEKNHQWKKGTCDLSTSTGFRVLADCKYVAGLTSVTARSVEDMLNTSL